MFAVKGHEGDALLLIWKFLLHLTDGLEGLVHPSKSLLTNDGHRTTLVDDNQIEHTLCLDYNLLLHNGNCFNHVNTLI